jgi:hypothetical protein
VARPYAHISLNDMLHAYAIYITCDCHYDESMK